MTDRAFARPRALEAGDRVALVAPASPFERAELEAGVRELRRLGFEPIVDPRIFERDGYLAGDAATRAAVLADAWRDPSIAGIVAVRGGYGTVHLLEHLDLETVRRHPKVLLGYSDVTSLLTVVGQACGLVCFHGPMVAGRLAAGPAAYDPDSLADCLTGRMVPWPIACAAAEAIRPGEAAGPLVGGNLTQLAASLGTPYAFDPPEGAVLFIEEVNERPYRLDRMLTQLRLAGLIDRASALLFGQMRGCDEPDTTISARATIARFMAAFKGPVVYGVPAGHTHDGQPAVTLPLGVRVRVVAGATVALVVEEPTVSR